MADFGERVLKLHPTQMSLFYLTMEETDNAVLYDHYKKPDVPAETDAPDKTKGKTKPRAGRKG